MSKTSGEAGGNTGCPEDIDLWILAGQSNMEGLGELTEAMPPDERVWSFTSAGRWEIAAEPLHRRWESFTPIHQILLRGDLPAERRHLSDAELAALAAKETLYAAGLGIAFGVAMAEWSGRPIGLMPCAHGATSLGQWSPSLKGQGGASLYGAMLERVKRCGRPPRGLLWYQGESEGWNLDEARTYAARFQQWVAAVREDLGRPNLPVLIVQIGRTTLDSPSVAAWEAVRAAQYEATLRVPGVAMTSAIDLALVDCIHLNSSALCRLGRRLARMARGLAAGQSGAEIGPRFVSATQSKEPPDRGVVHLKFTGVTGGWLPLQQMEGFDVLNAAGEPHAINHVIHAFRSRSNPQEIDVKVNIPLQAGERIVYGRGLRPVCNVVDEADMPLCASVMDVTIE